MKSGKVKDTTFNWKELLQHLNERWSVCYQKQCFEPSIKCMMDMTSLQLQHRLWNHNTKVDESQQAVNWIEYKTSRCMNLVS